MKVKDLSPNRKNPRKISAKKKELLKKSLEKFGDLSGIVFNKRTKTLISGHQRKDVLKSDAKIVIETKHEKPTRALTTAEGYIEIDGERFKYREVDADETWEMEALLAANKHGGDWDQDLLKLAIIDLPEMDLALAGFDEIEIAELDLPEDEAEYVDEHIDNDTLSEPEPEEDQSDEEYLHDNPGPDTKIEKEKIGSPFDKVEETQGVAGKRFVIIIDCVSEEKKQELRELIKDIVKNAGAKIF